MTLELAVAEWWRPVLPLLTETSASASAVPSTSSARTPTLRERLLDISVSVRACIVSPFVSLSARGFLHLWSTFDRRFDPPQHAAEKRRHPVARDEHPDDDRP